MIEDMPNIPLPPTPTIDNLANTVAEAVYEWLTDDTGIAEDPADPALAVMLLPDKLLVVVHERTDR